MGLPDRLNESPSDRFASSYSGPLYTPSEARAELARRKREREQATKARQDAANYETEVSADEYGIKTQKAGPLTLPKIYSDPSSGAKSLEYEPQNIIDTDGRKRSMSKAGRLEPIPQGVVQYLPGDSKTEGMADPSVLYRVEKAPEEIAQEGYDVGMRRKSRVEPVGQINLLTESDNPEIKIAARQNMISRNKSIYMDAKTLLENREAEAKNKAEGLRIQIEELKAKHASTPYPQAQPGSESSDYAAIAQENDRRSNELKLLENSRLEETKKAIDFGRQKIGLENLQKDAAHVELITRAVSNARARGEDPNKDPIVKSLKESYENLKIQAPEIENPAYMASPTDGVMVDPGEGSPEFAELQKNQGFTENARQNQAMTLENVKAMIEERKRKSDPIIQNRNDRLIEFNLKRTTRDKLAEKYNYQKQPQAPTWKSNSWKKAQLPFKKLAIRKLPRAFGRPTILFRLKKKEMR